ncbi:MAG: hypothetical protein H6835_10430 [Planctomycetes bacterium]|nr:hypothetical protein [Planctomycetota bacterium]
MPATNRLLASAFAVAVAATTAAKNAAAQGPGEARRPTFFRVVDAEGQALADAEVSVVGGLPHLSQTVVWPDVQRVATDRRGRAIAKLREDYCYVAWVVGPARERGVRLCGDAPGYFSAGALLEIECRQENAPERFDLPGFEAWADHAPLRLVAMTAAPGDEVELAPRADGGFDVPLGPYDVLEVRLPDGAPLWSTRRSGDVALPPPARLSVRVVDERGAPLAGVEILHRVARLPGWPFDGFQGVGMDRTRTLGRTDAEGRCEVVVPYDGSPLQQPKADLLLLARAEGRPVVAGGIWNDTRFVDDRRVAAFEGDELVFTCKPLAPLVGVAPGAPRGTVVHLGAVCKLFMRGTGYLHDQRAFTAAVSANGRFELADVPADLHACLLTFVPPPDSDWQPPLFPPQPGRSLPPELVPSADGHVAPIPFGASTLRVLDVGGGPALGAVAFVTPSDRHGVLTRDAVRRVPLGSRGDARLDLLPGSWVVVVVTQRAYGFVLFEAEPTGADVRLQLQPMATMAVALVDRDGQPVVGARLRSRGSSTRGAEDAAQTILQSLRGSSRVAWGGLRTDADGALTIPFLPVDGVTQRLDLRWDGRTSEEFTLEAGAAVEVREKR